MSEQVVPVVISGDDGEPAGQGLLIGDGIRYGAITATRVVERAGRKPAVRRIRRCAAQDAEPAAGDEHRKGMPATAAAKVRAASEAEENEYGCIAVFRLADEDAERLAAAGAAALAVRSARLARPDMEWYEDQMVSDIGRTYQQTGLRELTTKRTRETGNFGFVDYEEAGKEGKSPRAAVREDGGAVWSRRRRRQETDEDEQARRGRWSRVERQIRVTGIRTGRPEPEHRCKDTKAEAEGKGKGEAGGRWIEAQKLDARTMHCAMRLLRAAGDGVKRAKATRIEAAPEILDLSALRWEKLRWDRITLHLRREPEELAPASMFENEEAAMNAAGSPALRNAVRLAASGWSDPADWHEIQRVLDDEEPAGRRAGFVVASLMEALDPGLLCDVLRERGLSRPKLVRALHATGLTRGWYCEFLNSRAVMPG